MTELEDKSALRDLTLNQIAACTSLFDFCLCFYLLAKSVVSCLWKPAPGRVSASECSFVYVCMYLVGCVTVCVSKRVRGSQSPERSLGLIGFYAHIHVHTMYGCMNVYAHYRAQVWVYACVCVTVCVCEHVCIQAAASSASQYIPWRFLRPNRKFSSVENYRQWLRKGKSLFAGFFEKPNWIK